MSEAFSKFLDKIPTDKLYEDLFQPGLKKVGIALETVIDYGNTILLPLKIANGEANIRLSQHLKDYEKKLAEVSEEELHKVPEYIGLPVIDKLLLLNSNDLSDAFINLLAKASTSSTLGLVHPGFIQTLENLSVDEAKILFHFKNAERIQFINLVYKKYKELIKKPHDLESEGPKTRDALTQQINYTFQDREEVTIEVAKYLTNISNVVSIDFKDNVSIYIDNLHRLGLIEFISNRYNADDAPIYSHLEEDVYKEYIGECKKFAEEFDKEPYKLSFYNTKGYIIFSQYGKAFLNACVKSIEESRI